MAAAINGDFSAKGLGGSSLISARVKPLRIRVAPGAAKFVCAFRCLSWVVTDFVETPLQSGLFGLRPVARPRRRTPVRRSDTIKPAIR
jgi:hypothetical protein